MDMGEREHYSLLVGVQTGAAIMGNSVVFPQKARNRFGT